MEPLVLQCGRVYHEKTWTDRPCSNAAHLKHLNWRICLPRRPRNTSAEQDWDR